MFKRYVTTLAEYNRWANRRLYAACAELTRQEYHKARPSFFGSIHGTLNHLILTDRNWFGRIEGNDPRLAPLNRVLYETFDELKGAREQEDQHILEVITGIDEDRLAADLEYSNTRGERFTTPLHLLLGHLFNHQTHHRAQVHDMLSQTEISPPPLDLLHFLRGTFD